MFLKNPLCIEDLQMFRFVKRQKYFEFKKNPKYLSRTDHVKKILFFFYFKGQNCLKVFEKGCST